MTAEIVDEIAARDLPSSPRRLPSRPSRRGHGLRRVEDCSRRLCHPARAAESLDDVTEPQVSHPDSAHPSRISVELGQGALDLVGHSAP